MTLEDIEKRISKEDTATYRQLEQQYDKLQEQAFKVSESGNEGQLQQLCEDIAIIEDRKKAEFENLEELYIASFNNDKELILKTFNEELSLHSPMEDGYRIGYLFAQGIRSRQENRPVNVTKEIMQGGYESFGNYLLTKTILIIQAWTLTGEDARKLIPFIDARASAFFEKEEANFFKALGTQATRELGRFANVTRIDNVLTAKYWNGELTEQDSTATGRVFVNNKECAFSFRSEFASKWTEATSKLWAYIMKEYTAQDLEKDLIITKKDYMDFCGISDIKTAQKNINDFQKAMLDSQILMNSKYAYGFKNIFASITIKLPSHDMIIRFTPEYQNYIKYGSLIAYPMELFRINARKNPNSYYFGMKLSELRLQRSGNNNHSVKTVLKSSPYIANGKDELGERWNTKQKIIIPFERDMNALHNILTWKYKEPGEKGKTIPKTKAQNLTYNEFMNLNIVVTWKDYPEDQNKYIKANRQKRITEKSN